MEKGTDPVQTAIDALREVDPATVVEPGDIRMAFEAAVDDGWRIVRTEVDPDDDAHFLLAEEWTP